jgi:hypothetical protein
MPDQEWDVDTLTYLAQKNPLPFDGQYLFRENANSFGPAHVYGIRTPYGVVKDGIISVSGLMPKEGNFEERAEKLAARFKRNLDKYLKNVRSEPPRKRTYRERHRAFDGEDLDRLTVDFFPAEFFERIETDPDYQPGEVELTGKDVMERWNKWCGDGTDFHSYAEHVLNQAEFTGTLAQYELEKKQFDEMLRDFKGEWFRTEVRLGSLEHLICGTPDVLYWENGELVIGDWKRSRNVMNPETGEKKHSYDKYLFQLTAYKKLLELNGIQTSNTGYLYVFHPIYDTYQKVPLDLTKLRKEVEDVFEARRLEVLAREEAAMLAALEAAEGAHTG